jgi:hypothetical protein
MQRHRPELQLFGWCSRTSVIFIGQNLPGF